MPRITLCQQFTYVRNALLSVSGDLPSNTSLNTYIRDHAKLRGTKAMCHEGGCGACIVAAEIKGETMAVNSCLVPILICDGYAIINLRENEIQIFKCKELNERTFFLENNNNIFLDNLRCETIFVDGQLGRSKA